MITTKFKQTNKFSGRGTVNIARTEKQQFKDIDYNLYDIFIEPIQSLTSFFLQDNDNDEYSYNTYRVIIDMLVKTIAFAKYKDCNNLVDIYIDIDTDGEEGPKLYTDVIKAYIVVCYNNMNSYFKEKCEKRWIIDDNNYLYYDNYASRNFKCAYYLFDKDTGSIFIYNLGDKSFYDRHEFDKVISRETLLTELKRGKGVKDDKDEV